ncbi:MAG: BNR-4 repeat-containing protein [Nitrospirae bacterium]|nr:BNR-4 repeat-containing protein [Nitrospirota bacterium]
MQNKLTGYTLILATIFITLISFCSPACAVVLDSKDTRIDLPVLTTPNNAVTPQISADQNDHVYVVWSDNRGGPQKIYINTKFGDSGWFPRSVPISTSYPKPPGVTEDGNATLPQVCSDNSGHVYVVWVDDRAFKAGVGKRDIYFRYSKDYGATWYPEFIDYRIDSDNPGIGDSINPQIACNENGNVYIVWQDDRNRAGIYEVYFRSLQVQFSKPVDFIVPYQTPELRLNTGVDAGKYQAAYPVISTDKDGNVYVAWQDSRNIPEDSTYPGIYFNSSKNHGATWGSKATRIDSAPVGFYQSLYPVISSDEKGHVYAAWLDNAGRVERGDEFAADGSFDVYFNVSSDYGVSWSNKDRRIDTPAKKVNAKDVAIASNNQGIVCVVWADNSQAEGEAMIKNNFNIFLNHSENYGASFRDSDSNIRIDTGVTPGTTNAVTPKVKIDNIGNVFVGWLDQRSMTQDIYINFSIEKGRNGSWLKSDIRLDYPSPAGDSVNLAMAIDNIGHVYAAWQDDRITLAKDNYNIYFIGGFLDIEALLIAGQRLGEACFIATAAYGSPFESHVELLRNFRDRYLLTNKPGKWFVSTYYRLSPPIAQFILEHPYLRPAARIALLPFVGIAALALYTSPLQKILLIFSLTVAGWALPTIIKGISPFSKGG